MAAPWEGVLQTTIPNFMRKVSDNTIRQQQFLAMTQSKGHIEYGMGGTRYEWKVQFKQKMMQTYTDGQTPTFDRVNRWQSPTLDWRAYQLPESITKLETYANQGPQAIISLMNGRLELLTKEMRQQFGSQVYVDGNAAGNLDKIMGLESFFSISGAATNGYVGVNNDSYAGLSTALGNYGGSWSQSGGATTWPIGQGDVQYDFWTPPVVLYDDAAFGAGADWDTACEEVLSFAIVHTQRNGGKDGELDCFLLDRELYRLYLAFQRDRQRVEITRAQSTTGQAGLQADMAGGTLVSMGFPGVIMHDGVEVTREYNTPVGVGYGLNFDEIAILNQGATLFEGEGPVWSTPHQAYLFFVGFYGNMQINPRAQCKLQATPS